MNYNWADYLYMVVKKYGIIALLSCVDLFLLGSLVTFNPTDQSWFYHTTKAQVFHNIFGMLGSYTASLMIYFFGSASLVFPLFLMYAIIFYYGMQVAKKMSIATEWDRMLGVATAFASCLVLCQIHAVVSYDFTYPGGMLGNYISKKIVWYFDPLTQAIIVWSLLVSSLILITRCSYIPALQSMYACVVYICDPEKLPARIMLYVIQMIGAVCSYALQCLKKIYEIFSGAIVQRIDTSIVEFEYEKNIDRDIDTIVHDLFWDEYIGHGQQKKDTIQGVTLDQNAASKAFNQNLKVHTMQLEEAMVAKNIEFQREHQETLFDLPLQAPAKEKIIEKKVVERPVAPEAKKDGYTMPFLPSKKVEQKAVVAQQEMLAMQAKLLEQKLEQFDIKGTVVAMHAGPVVILFEYQPDIKVKVSRILSLEDDLAMALKALSIRIIAPIPGRSVVGFEVANAHRQDVLFSTILDSPEFKKHTGSLPMIYGQDTLGNNIVADLAKMPHLLIAGSTGSGKSVALNAMLVSLLCSLRPDQLKLIIIDPKRLEFAAYDGIAHLIFPIVTETKKAIPVLKWVVQTMEERYKVMASFGVRNLGDYQAAAKLNKDMEPMPFIVVIIDELADLMMTAGKAVEDSIARLAQMARAAGIHMIIATQRPSVDVITGMIKVNFPNRVAFKVTSKIDSRTILDASGAEKLLGRGDMLFLDASKSNLVRVHGAYVSDAEIHAVVAQIKAQQKVQYLDLFEQFSNNSEDELLDADDELYQEVLTLLKDLDEVSISMLQRRFRIGYNRSARIISILESKGLIMSIEGGKTRRVVR